MTVTGLNDRELPSADMLVVQVAGLCIGEVVLVQMNRKVTLCLQKVVKIKKIRILSNQCSLTFHQCSKKRILKF